MISLDLLTANGTWKITRQYTRDSQEKPKCLLLNFIRHPSLKNSEKVTKVGVFQDISVTNEYF